MNLKKIALGFLLFASASLASAVTVNTPSQFNYSWLSIPKYGVSEKVGGTSEGEKAYLEVVAQSDAYIRAKEAGVLQGMLDNALSTSIQAWALQNKGLSLIKSITEPLSSEDTITKATEAETLLNQAINLVNSADKLGAGENQSQANAFRKENKARKEVLVMAQRNLLYVERVLGKKPWPKVKK